MKASQPTNYVEVPKKGIDGEKVLDLLIEYGLGVKKIPVYYYEFTPEAFSQFEEDGI